MEPEERLRVALAQKLWAELHETGDVLFFDDTINALGAELGGPQHLIDHVTRQLVNEGSLYEKDHGFFDGIELARAYGERHARDEWRAGNAVGHRILKAAVAGYEGTGAWNSVSFTREKCEPPMDASFEELAAAAKVLEALGYIELEQASGGAHYVALSQAGYDLVRDEQELRRVFPTTSTEDEDAHLVIVPDVLSELITTCERLLRERGWDSALEELERGDKRHSEGNWPDAVGEYYSAVESALRYRIHDAGETAGDGLALAELAKRAAELRLIPPNYQALFTFLNSIRSPRKHGRGPRPVEVEVGPAESLLMGNHARALLVYLGHRP
jgi:hypothetical protein